MNLTAIIAAFTQRFAGRAVRVVHREVHDAHALGSLKAAAKTTVTSDHAVPSTCSLLGGAAQPTRPHLNPRLS